MAGRPPKITDIQILCRVVEIEGPATATELIEELDINRSGMNKRLDDLVSRGLLNEKTVGANAVVYWLTNRGEEYVNENSPTEHS